MPLGHFLNVNNSNSMPRINEVKFGNEFVKLGKNIMKISSAVFKHTVSTSELRL